MSKVDELIQELCPNGVAHKPLGEVGVFTRGNGLQKNDFTETGFPCIHYGQIYTYYGIYTNKTKSFISPELARKLVKAKSGDVIITNTSENLHDVGKAVVWCGDGEVATGGHATVFSPRQVTGKYFAYYTQTAEFFREKRKYAKGTKVIDVSAKDMEKIKIPVPPIKVQNEITQILDKFTALETELEAELEARKTQYGYYRSNLLAIKDEVRQLSLEDLCTTITDGSHISPKSVEDGYYMPSVKDMRFNDFDLSSCKKISKEDYEMLVRNGCRPQKNDVLIAKDGSMLKYVFPIEEEKDMVLLSSIAILRPKIDIINPKYLSHFFRQEKFKSAVIRNFSSKGGVPRIILKNFKKVKIPVPSIAEQNQIVSVLDKFDYLIHDFSNGLPAEINARHKQYEYYRDELFTFKDLIA
jgi:type I restriction enzyme S subunit